MDPLKFLKDISVATYNYVTEKTKNGYAYLVDKNARWRSYYKEIKR